MSLKVINKPKSNHNEIIKNDEITMDLDSRYLNKIKNISFRPIFILGYHRSGTSILYTLLTATQCFNSVTAYHVIKYNQLLHNHINNHEKSVKKALNNFFIEHKLVERGLDRLKLSSDFPEEYRFIFTEKYYRPKITPENLPLFIEICKKIQFLSDNDKPLLLKNPFDFPNFIYIKTVFPNSKFVFIHRNPIKVINSNIKSINYLFKKKNFYAALLSKEYEKLVENPLSLYIIRFFLFSTNLFRYKRMIQRMANVTNYFLLNINLLNQDDYIQIRYEDLCKKPEETMQKIMNFFGLKTKFKINYYEFIKPGKTILLKEIQHLRPYIIKKMKKYLSYCKY